MLWNYLTGYVIIQIDGMGLERFVNAMLHAGIPVWDVRREADGSLSACVSVAGFYALHRLDRRGAGVHIRRKGGLLIRLSRLRERKVLLYGWIAALLLLLWASRMVWVIEVNGCDRVSEQVVHAALRAQNAYSGAPRRSLATAALRDAIIAADARIAMATVSLSGVVLRVEVREAADTPQMLDESVPANVCAARDGIILSVTPLRGRAMVAPGDAVRAGDVLISGELTRQGEEPLRVCARGEVIAQVAYTFGAVAPDAQTALDAAMAGLATVNKEAKIVEKTSRLTHTEQGVQAVIVVIGEEDIARNQPLE